MEEEIPGVSQDLAGDVLVLTIDNPPVNASSQEVRRGLCEGLERLDADDNIRAAVIIGARGSFVAGSDISEFGGDVPLPLLPTVIERIERSDKPVVAAIDGVALGGGLELALGCDARVATRSARIALPEVSLGMLPGAGGTQRLPRLAGKSSAAEMILTGNRVSSDDALDLGIIDAIVESELLSAAVDLARATGKRRVMDLPVPAAAPDFLERSMSLLGARARPNAREALRLVVAAGTQPGNEALAEERRAFTRFRSGEDAAALRHLFFAERQAPRRCGVPSSQWVPDRAAVVGAGAMGTAICAALAMAGIAVALIDTDHAIAEDGARRSRELIDGAVSRGKLTEEAREAAKARVTIAEVADDLSDVQIIIEAVFEDVEVKRSVLRALQRSAPDAILATNTSYLNLGALAEGLPDATKLVGLHFFNPAHIMRLVEVIPLSQSSEQTVGGALGLARAMGKQAVIARDAEGFIGNRVNTAYRRHAEYLLEDGALPEQVDRAMEDFGFPMGPFAVADLSGLQIAQSLRLRWLAQGTRPNRYVEIPDVICELGRFGRRTGKGYYDYSTGSRTTDPIVTEVILAESARKGITRRKISDEEVVERLVGAMVVEGARLREAGVAKHADDVDVALVAGFGFPRYLGGPMWWAARKQQDAVAHLTAAVGAAARERDENALVARVIARG